MFVVNVFVCMYRQPLLCVNCTILMKFMSLSVSFCCITHKITYLYCLNLILVSFKIFGQIAKNSLDIIKNLDLIYDDTL